MRRSVPLSLLVPLLALTATLALLLGSVGTATAGPALTKKTVKKLATQVATQVAGDVVAAQAPRLSVADASQLAGRPASAYQTQALSIDIAGVANAPSFDKALPAIPAGTYQASLYLTASMTNGGAELFCTLYQSGQSADLMDAYGARYQSFRTVSASRLITVTGAVRLFCRPSGGSILAIPANPDYAPAQLSLVRVDSATPLGVSSRTAAR